MRKLLLCGLFIALGCGPTRQSTQSNQPSGSQTGSGGNQVRIGWTSNRGEQQGFYIEESSDGVSFSQVMTVPDGTNSAVVSVPQSGRLYYFRIRGYNQAGDSPYSAVVTAQI